MRKTLTPIGEGLGLVIDKAILDLLDIDTDTLLEVKTDGDGLIIRPLRDAPPVPRTKDRSIDTRALAVAPTALPSKKARSTADSALDSKAPPAPPAPKAPAPPAPKAPAPPVPNAKTAPPPPAPLSAPEPPTPPKIADAPKPPAPKPLAPPPPNAAAKEDAPEIVIEKDGKLVKRVPFVADQMTIGREIGKVDLPLDDRALSREHLRIEKRGASIWVNDLGSANGTFINGERVHEAMRLEASDVLELGHFVVHIEGLEERALSETPVLTLDGPEGLHRFALVGEEILIGRSTQCDISIGHRSISRKHLRILATPQGFEVENLGSQNGIKLNGTRVEGKVPFQQGDVLRVCDFTFALGVFEEEANSKPNRPKTMLIDRSVMAGAAYMDGEKQNISSGEGMRVGRGGDARPETGEFHVS